MKSTFDSFLELAAAHAERRGTILLLSAERPIGSQRSYLFVDPLDEISCSVGEGDDPWEALKRLMPLGGGSSLPEWAGYFGYEMGACADPEKSLPFYASPIPDLCFLRHRLLFCYDHAAETLSREERRPLGIRVSKGLLGRSFRNPPGSKEEYLEAVKGIKELIAEGEVYQVNLSHEFSFEASQRPFELFRSLFALNPAPFSAYLNLEPFHLVSSSPERLLSRKGPLLETRPIKGTAPRREGPEEDARSLEALLGSEKEKAELFMIIDLMRHDLARISEPGSVEVRDKRLVESYRNVFHTLAVLRSRGKKGLHPVDMVRGLFPGGSITGCPKLRAMEVLGSLEKRPRNIYTGSIGYFSENGDFDFNIAIRTLLFREGFAKFGLGGAIVADSDPEKEYLEILHKGASILEALQASV